MGLQGGGRDGNQRRGGVRNVESGSKERGRGQTRGIVEEDSIGRECEWRQRQDRWKKKGGRDNGQTKGSVEGNNDKKNLNTRYGEEKRK